MSKPTPQAHDYTSAIAVALLGLVVGYAAGREHAARSDNVVPCCEVCRCVCEVCGCQKPKHREHK